MTKKIKFFNLLLLTTFLFSGISAGSQTIKINTGDPSFKVIENTYYELKFENTLTFINSLTIKTKEGLFCQLAVPGYGYSVEIGEPKLPVLKKLIEIPYGADIEIRILNEKFREFSLSEININNPLIPAQPPVSKNEGDPQELEFFYNRSTYQKDEFAGQELVKVIELGILRGVKIARLEIAPVRYNPVANSVKVFDEIEVEIIFRNPRVERTESSKAYGYSPYFESNYRQLINYKPVESRALPEFAPVTYIIVSDPMFQNALQPFIEWKTKKGFDVIEAYTDDPQVGNTTTSIKNYLENFYNNPPAGFNPQSFVLIVGDVAQIPAFNGSAGSHVTDLYYCEYTGDIFPEAYYGRFSANNLTELQPQIDKTLEYEQYQMPDPSFLDEVVMVAGHDNSHQLTWGNGQINYGTEYYFNAAHGIFSHTYLQPLGSGAAEQIRQNVSDGVSYANYTAHCGPSGWSDPSFNTSHIPSLQNAHKYPLMVGNCCSSLEFQTTCFGEEVLRAENKGALGYIGGSNSTYWDEDFWWGVGFENISANPAYNHEHLGAYDRTFHDGGGITVEDWFVTQGQMPAAGNLAVTQAGSSIINYYWEIYHLMGDPSLMIYFSQPPDIAVSYPGLMPLGSTSFTVTTEPYAYVAISKDGILYGAALADESGTAEVLLEPITVPGFADVVVTRQNGKPFIGNVTVSSPAGPYVLLKTFEIDDSNGNNNGFADYGENLLLNVALQNFGSVDATDVTATLSTDDNFITINENTHLWQNIPAGEIITEEGAFDLSVSEYVPDGHIAHFGLEMSDGVETWTSEFSFEIHAPILEIGELTINDVAGGNGNGRLDPGEEAEILIAVSNTGHSEISGINAVISTQSEIINILSSTFAIDVLSAGETQNALFTILVDENAATGEIVDIHAEATAEPYSAQKDFSCTIGQIIEDFETGDFSKFNWQNSGNNFWVIDNSNAFQGSYCAKSGEISNYQTSEIEVTLEIISDGEISFWKKVSSESSYDYLRFYIDDNEQSKWSGTVDWSQETFGVTSGVHTFRWAYTKDMSVSSGDDCAWIDDIIFPPINTDPILEIGNMTIDESAGGNGNGIIEPGESFTVAIETSNTGMSVAPEVVALLVSNSDFITIEPATVAVGDLLPNQTIEVIFDITLDEQSPDTTIADLNYLITSGSVSDMKSFYIPVGNNTIEDFETGNFDKFNWQSSGNQPWLITDIDVWEGNYCSQSGDVNNGEKSGMFITMDVSVDDEISFYRKVSSKSNYDHLIFYLDDELLDEWSGIKEWEKFSYPVEAGEHTFKWVFEKDNSLSYGEDCAWVDYIEFPTNLEPQAPVAGFLADRQNILPGESIRFYDISMWFPSSWNWSFPGGEPEISTEKDPFVLYSEPGVFDVSLTVENQTGQNTITLPNFITVNESGEAQLINIPQGWSGISSYIIPENDLIYQMMESIQTELVIVQSLYGVYYPAQSINTIQHWDCHQGYKIKVTENIDLLVQGIIDPDHTLVLNEGWNIISVLSECYVDAAGLFSQIADDIVVAKEIAGNGVLWPAMNINTLGQLQPGKAYWVLVGAESTLIFPGCDGNTLEFQRRTNSFNVAAWNDVNKTASSHLIAVPPDVINNSQFEEGDVIGVFTNSGICVAITKIEELFSPLLLTVYGDDLTTSTIEGCFGDEEMLFRLYRNGETYDLTADFDPGMPNTKYFADNGISKISEMKLGSLSVSQNSFSGIEIYPNPSDGKFVLRISNNQNAVIEILNTSGQVVRKMEINPVSDIDLSNLQKGIYYLRVLTDNISDVKKIVIR